jgi:phosphonate transport system substrate-binding protein
MGVGLLAVLLLISGLWGCDREEAMKVRLNQRSVLHPLTSARQRPLRIGMGAMMTPKEGYIYYRQLGHYLEERLGMPVQLVDRDSYAQMNRLLESGEVDAAFVCAGPYVEGHDRFGLELLVAPRANGRSAYHSYIIVPKDSPARDFKELRGKTFAFTDPKSNSGKLIPAYMLSLMHETPETFFRKHLYSYGHDRSIKMVAEKQVDGAAVDSHIWEYTARKDPKLTAKTKIIAESPPNGMPPFVVTAGIDPWLKKRLQIMLLDMHKQPEGKKILEAMMIDEFCIVHDRDYDPIREMRRAVARQNGSR